MTNTSVPQPNKEPYYPPTRQDYRDLIEHHYLIRAFTFFPLIIVAVSMYMAADYGPLHFLTGVAMNVGVLATCLTVPLAIASPSASPSERSASPTSLPSCATPPTARAT